MNKSIKLIFNYFLAPLLFIVLCYSLYSQIIHQPDLPERLAQLKSSWQSPAFLLVFILMFVNWGIESWKWKISLKPLEEISYTKAFRSVLSGCSVTMLTPNRIGEYGGRILYLKEENRLTAISITILGSMSQLLVTLSVGSLAVLLISYGTFVSITDTTWVVSRALLIIGLISAGVLALLYFRINALVKFLPRLLFARNFVKHLTVLMGFRRKLLLRILFLSFLRYNIFILQYIIMLHVMKVNVPYVECFLLVSVFYLVMAIAPTAGFIELPVRAMASVQLFSLFSSNALGIQAAALAIWLINLVIPAIMGSLMIFGIKIMKTK